MVKKVLERELEAHFSKECKRLGVTSVKMALRFSTGVPDRMVLPKDSCAVFAELKTQTGVLSERQKLIHRQYTELGHEVVVLRSKQEITKYLENLA